MQSYPMIPHFFSSCHNALGPWGPRTAPSFYPTQHLAPWGAQIVLENLFTVTKGILPPGAMPWPCPQN